MGRWTGKWASGPWNLASWTRSFGWDIGAGIVAFNPFTDISGCIVGLQSDLGIIKDGSDRVSQWIDQTGQGNSALQATNAAKFVWTPNELNGYPALVADGIDDLMQSSIFTGGLVSQPNTTFFIIKGMNGGIANRVCSDGIGGVNRQVLYTGKPAATRVWKFYAGAETVTTDPEDEGGSYHLIIVVWNGANSYWYKDNSPRLGPYNIGTLGIDSLTLGADKDMLQDAAFNYVSLGLYNSLLSDANITLLQGWANSKYNIW